MKNVQKLLKKTFFIFWSTFRQHLLTNPIEMTSENDTIFENWIFGSNVRGYVGDLNAVTPSF